MPRKTILHAGKWLALTCVLLLMVVSPAAAQGNVHVVQRGENLYRIALRYGITVETLAQVNGIYNTNQIYAGQALVIPTSGQTAAPPPSANPPAAMPTTAPIYHIVQPGETLGTIAARYGVTWQELATANNIPNPNRILVGQQLVVMTSSGASTAATPPVTATDPVITTAPAPGTVRTHVVQPGESLSGIGRHYGLTWTTIARANNIADPNRIFVGQSLVIPAQNDPTSSTYMETTTGQPAGPTPTITNGRQIIVDLSEQRIYAFQDGQIVRWVTVSTGLPGTPTVVGDFNVYWRLTSQTMQGPGYYLPGVPWVMYFYQGYAIHGTYWHNNFGQPMSHGCVNLPTPEAEWFFNFAEVGTAVRVIY